MVFGRKKKEAPTEEPTPEIKANVKTEAEAKAEKAPTPVMKALENFRQEYDGIILPEDLDKMGDSTVEAIMINLLFAIYGELHKQNEGE